MNIEEDFTPSIILLGCTAFMCLVLGLVIGTTTARQETEEHTIVYCVEQPKDCKIKYDFYKLQEAK